MNVFLWVVAIALAVLFAMAGVMKATRPKEQLVRQLPWVEDYSRFLEGVVESATRGGADQRALFAICYSFEMVVRHANPAFADVVRILAWTGARPSTICRVEAKHYLSDLKRERIRKKLDKDRKERAGKARESEAARAF